MYKHVRLMLDLDGTTLTNAGPTVAEEDFGVDMNSVADHHGMMARLRTARGMTDDAFWDWWRERESLIYSRGIIAPGAVDVLQMMHTGGAFIQIITARGDTGAAATLKWLSDHGVPYDGIRFNNWNGKVSAVQEFNLNVAFEDEPRFAEPLAAVMPVVLFDGPHNRDVANREHLYRVTAWSQVPDALNQVTWPIHTL